jgi:hypothetical protein
MVTVDDLEEATRAQAPLGTRLEHAGNVEIRCGQRCRNRRVALEELGGQPASLMEPTSRRRTRLRRGESGELPHGCLRCRDGQPGSLEAPPDKVSEGRRQRVAAGRLRRCYTLVHPVRGCRLLRALLASSRVLLRDSSEPLSSLQRLPVYNELPVDKYAMLCAASGTLPP